MSNETKKPSHGVYSIRNYKLGSEDRSQWTQLGVAWAHKGGNGFNIKLNCLPVDGEMTIYPFADKKADTADQPAEAK